MEVVGISLVRNEDRFVERALLNVAAFCDRIFVADHMSADRTPAILERLEREVDHLRVRRVKHSAESHELIANLAGTDTWILSVDGDELYDPVGLARFRQELERGAYQDVFRLRPAGLHCDELDESSRLASGYLSPPSRPLVGLLNFAAIESWSGTTPERLHGGDIRFRPGFDLEQWRHLGSDLGWERSPFRVLHACFLRRSSDDPGVLRRAGRPNLAETHAYRHGVIGELQRFARRALRPADGFDDDASDWKPAKYRRGDRTTVDVTPFFA